ncbi:methyltransferase [Aureococcus anophagefferens]|nr:methyltransferase [Aureococcus anophagefferens]
MNGEIAAYGLLDGPDVDGDAARLASYVVDLESQIRIACSRDAFFDRWGAHYLRSLRSAHETATRHNFKDASVDTYFGAPASTLLAVADAAFAKLPAPKPSKQGRSGPRDMSARNSRCNGCVSGGSLVVRYGDRAPLRADAVVAGDVLLDAAGGPATVQCVVATAVARLRGPRPRGPDVALTPWHPVRAGGAWAFPADLGAEARVPCDALISLLFAGRNAAYSTPSGAAVLALRARRRGRRRREPRVLRHGGRRRRARGPPGFAAGRVVLREGAFLRLDGRVAAVDAARVVAPAPAPIRA